MASMLLHYFKRGEKTQNTVILIFRSSNCVLSIVEFFATVERKGLEGGGSPKIKGLRKRHAALHFENVHHPLGFLPIGLYL
jgi:hypothetical protein